MIAQTSLLSSSSHSHVDGLCKTQPLLQSELAHEQEWNHRRSSSLSISLPVLDPSYKSDDLEEDVDTDPSVYTELRALLPLILPIVLSYVLESLPAIVSIILVGHIDSPDAKKYVDAVALSIIVCMIDL